MHIKTQLQRPFVSKNIRIESLGVIFFAFAALWPSVIAFGSCYISLVPHYEPVSILQRQRSISIKGVGVEVHAFAPFRKRSGTSHNRNQYQTITLYLAKSLQEGNESSNAWGDIWNEKALEKSNATLVIRVNSNTTTTTTRADATQRILSQSDDDGVYDDPILEELEQVAQSSLELKRGATTKQPREKHRISRWTMKDRINNKMDILLDEDNDMRVIVNIVAVSVIVFLISIITFSALGVGDVAKYSIIGDLAQPSGDKGDFFQDLLDWKDLVAYVAGDVCASSVLLGLLYLGEVSLLRFAEDQLLSKQEKRDLKVDESSPQGIVGTIFSSLDGEEETGDLNWPELGIELSSWILYAFFKNGSTADSISNSALESATLGCASAIGARLCSDRLLVTTDIFPDSDDLREEVNTRSLFDWLTKYGKVGVSAGALFSVYDLVLHLLTPIG